MNRYGLLLVLLACCWPIVSHTAMNPIVGFRGDGTGVFRSATPITEWAETKNILWKTALPNLGQSSPICVNGRVFVTCEPGWKSDCPVLVCLDADNGRILWQREIDQFVLLPPDDREEAQRLRSTYFAHNRAAFVEACAARKTVRVGDNVKDLPEFRAFSVKYGFGLPTWHYGVIGMTFPTPVSDGTHIYVNTAYKTVACFDLDGNICWLRWDREEPYCNTLKRGVHLTAGFVQSPLLIGNKLIVSANHRLRAYDAASGETVWEVQLDWKFYGNGNNSNYMVGSPIHLQLAPRNGTAPVDVLFTASGQVVRVADGKLLADRIGQLGNGAGPVSDMKDVVFCTNGSTGGHYDIEPERRWTEPGGMAVKLEMPDPDTVVPRLLWQNPAAGSGEITPVYYDGILYVQNKGIRAIDPATGKVMWEVRDAAPTKQALTVAGGYLFTLNKQGVGSVIKLGSPAALVATNHLSQTAPIEGEKREQIIAQCGTDKPSEWYAWNFSPALPFFIGDRMYVRSHDFLYCIGATGAKTPRL